MSEGADAAAALDLRVHLFTILLNLSFVYAELKHKRLSQAHVPLVRVVDTSRTSVSAVCRFKLSI